MRNVFSSQASRAKPATSLIGLFFGMTLLLKLPSPRRFKASLLLFIVLPAAFLFAQEQTLVFRPQLTKALGSPHDFIPHLELAHPRMGLALSGGGARCLAQIGVLQALEENNFQIDFIAGTSMGSFVGGMYASGYSAKQLREIVKQISWEDIMQDTPPRKNLLLSQKQDRDLALLQVRFNGLRPNIPRALTAGQKLHLVLTELTWKANYWASGSFDHLRVPFRAIATDVYSGEEIVLEDGDLSEAIRASGALPLLISPVPRGDMLLVDGGVANNIPVDIVRRFGLEIVLAVDATSNLRTKERIASPWEFADQITTIMQQEKNARQRGAADLLISFEDMSRTSLDFTALDSLIDLGYQRMREQIPALRALYNARTHAVTADSLYSIRALHTEGAAALEAPLATFGRATLSTREIQSQVDSLYASGDFQYVEAQLRHDTLAYRLTRNPLLRSVRIRGNTIYADSLLLACVKSPRGAPINHQQGRRDLTALIEHYRRDGYALAQIQEVRFDSTQGALTIRIAEGVVSQITIEGLRHTQPLVVLREFALHTGEIFNSKRARQGIDNIHSTGLFESVALTPSLEAAGGVHLQIKVEEKAYNILRVGDYYQSERGNFAFCEAGNDNVWGTGSKFFLRGGLGKRQQEARMIWRSDRIFRTFLTLSASAYHLVQDNFVYDQQALDQTLGEYSERRGGVRLSVGQQVRRLGAVSAQLRWEEIRIGTLYGSGYPVGTSHLTAFEACSVIDTRDRVPFARGGRYLNFCYAYGKLAAPETESFIKFTAHLETFHTLGPHTLHVKALGGASDRTTPFSEQFRLGGPNQILGLREQQLFGRQFVLGSMAYRYQLRRRPFFDTYISVRYEVSGLWNDQKEASYKQFHHAWGCALSWDTPLGPVGIALGSFENRQRRIYFNIGVPL